MGGRRARTNPLTEHGVDWGSRDSVRDCGLFLTKNKRYRPLQEAKKLDDQIDALGKSGYATDRKYGIKIRCIINGKKFKELIG